MIETAVLKRKCKVSPNLVTALLMVLAWALAFASVLTQKLDAQESRYVLQGVLDCHVLSGADFSGESKARAICQFRSNIGGTSETYFARLHGSGEFGTTSGEARWQVFAPNGSMRPFWLANQYVGATPSLGLGTNVGEHSLVGGGDPPLLLRPAPKAAGTDKMSVPPVDEMVLTASH